MSGSRGGLRELYASALESYLASPGEAQLNYAYEFGRTALGVGLGVLDISVLHHEVLRALMKRQPLEIVEDRIGKAAEFFAESLSSFEMSLRGYQESNTRLVALNEALQQAKVATDAANHELEAFSYSVAHDLQAPLRGIDDFSQALLEDYGEKLDGEGREYLQDLRESVRSMAERIDDLQELFRITGGDIAIDHVDLSALAHEIIVELRCAEPGRAVAVSIAPGMTADGDQRLLRATLVNLLGNAWKFTGRSDAARIEVGVVKKAGPPTYFIRDNGVGFDMADADKLFGVFQRLPSASEFEGAGIGLATIQRIIRRHGGRIWAEAEVGKGATFHFTLGGKVAG